MRISLVIPVLNDGEQLAECLKTAVAQIRPADEILVVDNGSDDDSAGIARAFGATVLTEPERGIWAASARGYDAATGEVIARCDADCRLPADWLARIERQLTERPDRVAITGPGRFYDLSPVRRVLASVLYMRMYFFTVRGALANAALFGSNMAFRRSLWERVRGTVHRHDSEVHDDLDFALQIDPAEHVIYDRALRVGISGRPFRDPASMRKRLARARRTFALNWPEQLPWKRWRRRILAGRARPKTIG
ncbi:glycosyltransferase family 2 protein [Lysobacter korlensis]|uniref:Glycosyltransferase family 2 protein n=1 Tax=Lysobacter korlensis TaxID=553636 RepID=A0ABV6RZ18_9GAMM